MALQRLAMIGARGHTNYVLDALPRLPQVQVVGVSDGAADDSAAPLVQWCKSNGHEPAVFDDYRKMLDTVRADAVVVCGPFELHAQMSIDAIERGLHVFAEKPIALTLDDLARLRTAHNAHPQVHIAGMMGIRYDPGFFTAWKLIKQDAIGDVRLINARKSYKLGKRPAYYHDRATYGGTIPWVGSHAIDWAMWMCGHKLESIYATHSSEHNDSNGTMERAAQVQLGFCKGRSASISIDVFRPASAPSHGDDWIRIVGTTGVIEARNRSLTLINEANNGTQPVDAQSDRQVFVDFVDHIDGKRPALIDAAQTFALTEVCLLARDSADQGGQVIRIEEKRSLKYRQTDSSPL